jgi:hypothetical protein
VAGSLRRRTTTPHSSGFARLDLEHFSKPSKFGLFTEPSRLIILYLKLAQTAFFYNKKLYLSRTGVHPEINYRH